MQFSWLLVLLFLAGCQTQTLQKSENASGDFTTAPGWVSVFQTMTSDTESTINILRPRLANMAYVVEKESDNYQLQWPSKNSVKVIKTTQGPNIHWAVDRIHVKSLKPGVTYRLSIVNKWRKKAVDWRTFKTLNVNKTQSRFIVGSCMSDSHAFEHVRKQIWDKMLTHNADFLMLLGDEVYVDDFDFVKRNQANEFDIWTRYIDSFRKIPLFQNRMLIPIFAVWDDHDFGTNNSNKNFKSKKAAQKVFNAFFGGETIPGYFERADENIYFSFKGFGQKFIFMDDRYYREPNGPAKYGHWGKKQHQWLEKQIQTARGPIWLANGDQFFTKATVITRKDGSKKQVNETFVDDHPKHFEVLMQDLRKASQPVVFLSGDIHYSELVGIEKEVLGYPTYEVTSSPIHSYIFRSTEGPETWLDNPRRLISIKEHNYLLIDSQVNNDVLEFKVHSYGVKQDKPYFEKSLQVQKKLATVKKVSTQRSQN
jgi:phosphodiesterase/alkaline phosphatase D-like protein